MSGTPLNDITNDESQNGDGWWDRAISRSRIVASMSTTGSVAAARSAFELASMSLLGWGEAVFG